MQTVDNEAWLSKADAARVLGVSVRQLELKTAQGLIRKETLPKKPNERAARVVYSREDLDAIKAGKPNNHAGEVKTAPMAPDWFDGRRLTAAETRRQLEARARGEYDPIYKLAGLVAQAAKVDPKPWLTLAEAAEYSGLPATWLVEQARAGKLRAVNVGHGAREFWRFNREGLTK
jgi:Helix-turn-helix domain